MKSYTNQDLCALSGLNARQVTHLAERGIVAPDVAEASGQGTCRRYSQWNLFEVLFFGVVRKVGYSFDRSAASVRALRALARHSCDLHIPLLKPFYTEVGSECAYLCEEHWELPEVIFPLGGTGVMEVTAISTGSPFVDPEFCCMVNLSKLVQRIG